MFWDGRRSAVDLGASPDWELLARAFGVVGPLDRRHRRRRRRPRRDARRGRPVDAPRPHRPRGQLPADVPPRRPRPGNDRLSALAVASDQRRRRASDCKHRGGGRLRTRKESPRKPRVGPSPPKRDLRSARFSAARDHRRREDNSSSVSVRGSKTRRPSSMRPINGGSPARNSGGERVRRAWQRDDRPRELEQRERAAADTRGGRDDGRARDERGERRGARGEHVRRRVEHREHRDLLRRVAVQPQRRLQRGQRELVDPQRPRQRVRPRGLDRGRAADEQPRLRPAEQLVAGEARPAPHPPRPSAARSARPTRATARLSRRRRSPARRARTAARSGRPRRSRPGRSSSGARAGSRRRRRSARARSPTAACGWSFRPRPARHPPEAITSGTRNPPPISTSCPRETSTDRPPSGRDRQQRGARAVVDREARLGAGQRAQQRLRRARGATPRAPSDHSRFE